MTKRRLLIVILVLVLGYTRAQVKKYWVGDTAHVSCLYFDTLQEIIPDTSAYLRLNKLNPEGDTAILYWDRNMQQRYKSVLTGNNTSNDTTFYRNGSIDEIFYRNGLKEIEFYIMGWYPDGKKKEEQVFKGDQKIETFYYSSGNIKAIETFLKIHNDPAYFLWVYTKRFCENGTVIVQDSANSLMVRKIERHFCDGSKEAEFTLFQGHALGKYRFWYPNGQPKIDGQFIDTIERKKINDYNDKAWGKQGKWSYYNENGKLIKEEMYKDGEVLSEKKY